ncbi:monosaccharide ABC transporter ATP-binding protein (CUT2 family) [Aliiruegeria haliotis]|uniref:Monosaccharide ABC transporter ATP-binding protein (CUT2 family) n=1 Tax=Aliiruegeria haliotis TaxID=1280846 RepID=A0A2T0RM00_9RHOB|nr:ATP-binding cassette domain-containing protein [Aliiruegeria haliotis]PRY22198.1 monosaccharide ABC transporter ATP-binding protein (CUT2 family) [Aliiruegeria haliotis]
METQTGKPLVEMRGVFKAFGGVHAVEDVDVTLHAGEVVAVLGHNGAGKSTLMKMLAGAYRRDAGSVHIDGKAAELASPAEAFELGIETIHQTLALADNLDATANLFLGREIAWRVGPFRIMDSARMRDVAAKVISQLNPRFTNLNTPCRDLSGGQRQTIAIARAIHFEAHVLIMDEPTAALGPHETAMVADLIRELKSKGIGIFLISHDIHDVFDLADRVVVMKNGQVVGTANTSDVSQDDVLGMIILGKCPEGAIPGPGARSNPQ